jgi:hypothetical protein
MRDAKAEIVSGKNRRISGSGPVEDLPHDRLRDGSRDFT